MPDKVVYIDKVFSNVQNGDYSDFADLTFWEKIELINKEYDELSKLTPLHFVENKTDSEQERFFTTVFGLSVHGEPITVRDMPKIINGVYKVKQAHTVDAAKNELIIQAFSSNHASGHKHFTNLSQFFDLDPSLIRVILKLFLEILAEMKKTSLLYVASEYGYQDSVKFIVEKGKELPNFMIDSQEYSGQTALMAAIINGHADIAEILLNKKSSPNIKDNDGCTCLHYAVKNNDIATTKLLLDNGAKCIPNNHGNTPLHLAAELGNTYLADILIDNGTDINQVNPKNKRGILQFAAKNPSVDNFEYFMGHEKLRNTTWTTYGLLHIAAAHDNLTLVNHLCFAYEYKLDYRDKRDGLTPLMLAVKYGANNVVDYLVRHGAKVLLKSKKKHKDYNAIDMAIAKKNLDALKTMFFSLNPQQTERALDHIAKQSVLMNMLIDNSRLKIALFLNNIALKVWAYNFAKGMATSKTDALINLRRNFFKEKLMACNERHYSMISHLSSRGQEKLKDLLGLLLNSTSPVSIDKLFTIVFVAIEDRNIGYEFFAPLSELEKILLKFEGINKDNVNSFIGKLIFDYYKFDDKNKFIEHVLASEKPYNPIMGMSKYISADDLLQNKVKENISDNEVNSLTSSFDGFRVSEGAANNKTSSTTNFKNKS